MADWASTHRLWEKWASSNIGSSGEPLKAALLLNYDPNGPSRLLSVMENRRKKIDKNMEITISDLKKRPPPWFFLDSIILLNKKMFEHVVDVEETWKGSLSALAEQEGTKFKAIDLHPFLDFVKRNNLQKEFFFIGSSQYLVTSIHEHWFCARSVNASKPGGEGVIVMQTGAFLLVALYEGSIGSASRAMVAADQFAWQLGRKNH